MGITLFQRQNALKPPPSFGPNFSKSILSGLEGFMYFGEGAGTTRVFPGGVGLGTLSGSIPAMWSTAHGNHCIALAPGAGGNDPPTAAWVDFGTPAHRFVDMTKGPMSVAAGVLAINGGGVFGFVGGAAQRNDGSNNGGANGWEIGFNDGEVQFGALYSTQSLTGITPVAAAGLNRWTGIGATYNGPNLTASGNLRLYADGRDYTSSSTLVNGVGTSGTDAGGTLFLGKCTGSVGSLSITGPFPGWMLWFAGWKRLLSPSEMCEVTNPVNLFLLYGLIKGRSFSTGVPSPPVNSGPGSNTYTTRFLIRSSTSTTMLRY